MSDSEAHEPAHRLNYWLQWQVMVSALMFSLPASIAVYSLLKRRSVVRDVGNSDPSETCWKNLNPGWLLFYRTSAFLVMAIMFHKVSSSYGLIAFHFYTQWSFTLEMLYFLVAAIVSVWGLRIHQKAPYIFIKKAKETTTTRSESRKDRQLDFLKDVLLIMYQISGGAAMLTDIVFWCLLVPFLNDENFEVTVLMGGMHSVNLVFLITESSLNHMPFTWFGLNYFILWSCIYVIFQWTLHACCVTWWPYPFLELSTPWAPLWYLAIALIHLPCYGAFVLLIKAKDTTFSRLFPSAFKLKLSHHTRPQIKDAIVNQTTRIKYTIKQHDMKIKDRKRKE